MRNEAETLDQLLSNGIAPHRAFLRLRRRAWYSNDDGTAASLPAVLSRQISPCWIGEDGRLNPELTCPGSTPLQLAYAYHAMSSGDPLDTERNEYPKFILPECPAPVTEAGNGHADLYFIGADEGPIKIGISSNVKSRLKALQTGYPYRLKILAVAEGGAFSEISYHEHFAEHRLVGEWFARSPEILAEIGRLNQQVPA